MTLGVLAFRPEDREVLVRELSLAARADVFPLAWAREGGSVFEGLERRPDLVFVHDPIGRGRAEGCLDFFSQAHGGSSLGFWALASRDETFWTGLLAPVFGAGNPLPPGEWFLGFVCGTVCRLGIPLDAGGKPAACTGMDAAGQYWGSCFEELGLTGCWGLIHLIADPSGRITWFRPDPAPELSAGGLFRRSLQAAGTGLTAALEDLMQEALTRRDRQAVLRTYYKDGV